MNEILYQLCESDISIMNVCQPVPARLIAERLNLTVNQVRYQLRKLRTLGYVKTISEYVRGEELHFPYHGWTITDKAKETEEYKKAWEEEREIYKKYFDTDIGELK